MHCKTLTGLAAHWMSWRVGVAGSRPMECFRSLIYSVLMFASRMMRPYSLYCLRREAPNSAPHVPTGSDPWMTRSASVNQPVSWETVSFDVFAQR